MAKANQKQSNGSVLNLDTRLGKVIDEAMSAIERENPTLKGVLSRDYARPSLDNVRLGGLVENSSLPYEHHCRSSANVFASCSGIAERLGQAACVAAVPDTESGCNTNQTAIGLILNPFQL